MYQVIILLRKIIREASSDDASLIVDMIRAVAEEGVFYSPVTSVENFYHKFVSGKPREGYKIFVCQIGDKIVGYIDSDATLGVGRILSLYIKLDYRKKGIGSELIKETLFEFLNRGCHKARLEVFASNQVAIGFYMKLGFVQEGYLREDQEKKDTIIMSKFL